MQTTYAPPTPRPQHCQPTAVLVNRCAHAGQEGC